MRKITIPFIIILLFSGCLGGSSDEAVTPTTLGDGVSWKSEGAECSNHTGCLSGVCNHLKKDWGECAAIPCEIGERTDNNNYYCGFDNMWKPSKKEGETCEHDFECYQPTCFMIPSCDLTTIPRTRAACINGFCMHRIEEDDCSKQGLVKILRKDQYRKLQDGTCVESMAQRILPTVCTSCGNSICETELESECNCPIDCTLHEI